jgi:hypothetical protein
VRVPLAGVGHGAALDVAHDGSLDERRAVDLSRSRPTARQPAQNPNPPPSRRSEEVIVRRPAGLVGPIGCSACDHPDRDRVIGDQQLEQADKCGRHVAAHPVVPGDIGQNRSLELSSGIMPAPG